MIEYHDLVSRVKNCIKRKQEGSSWDFKKQWYSNNSDLLHDIICMSNLLEKEDGLIVIGVDESADYALRDVRNDSNRKRTQDLVCLLRDKKFAGGVRPIVSVQEVRISGIYLDAIIIENTRNTPYYLTEDFQGIHANYIYTRVMDTNTPRNASADINIVERLWRKRFAMDTSALETVEAYLQSPQDWVSMEDNSCRYYKYAPEYTIEDTLDDSRDSYEYYLFSQRDPRPHWFNIYIRCHQTTLVCTSGTGFDGGRFFTVTPEITSFSPTHRPHFEAVFFRSYTKGTLNYSLYRFFAASDTESEAASAERRLLECVPVFESEEEKQDFLMYAAAYYNENAEIKTYRLPHIPEKLRNDENPDFYRKAYKDALIVMDLLNIYRKGEVPQEPQDNY